MESKEKTMTKKQKYIKIPYCSISSYPLPLLICDRVVLIPVFFSSYLFCILFSVSSIMVRQNSSARPCLGDEQCGELPAPALKLAIPRSSACVQVPPTSSRPLTASE